MNLIRTVFRALSRTPLLVLALSAAARLTATSYYVDYSTGLDTNLGTSNAMPWRHCPGDPAATGAAATATLVAGDTVFFKGGVTYVFTGSTGIQVQTSGTAGAPITFDGNSNGTWGTGRAKLTDNCGAHSIAAFSSTAPIAYVTFTSLDIGAIGGAATLPPDTGSPVAARYGAGLVFNAGLSNATITGCVFHDLGYAFNQKPMSASSLAGAAIAMGSCDSVTIADCDFSHSAAGIELRSAAAVANLTVTNCTFHDFLGWTIDLPPPPVSASNLQLSGCVESSNSQLSAASWTGYGPSPRTDVQNVTAGASVTFNATAAASPAATFQWNKNGVAILGATNATYTIASASTTDAGNYSVIATNSMGSTTSDDAILNVQAVVTTIAPTITTQPASVVTAPLSSATFTVAASGTPTPTYQWLKNGVAIPGWTDATLTLIGVSTTDVATYAAVATNSAGSATSASATLTLSSTSTTSGATGITATAPAFTAQPNSQTVNAGANVSFTVSATGSPTPTLQWLKNGAAISGATDATLTLSAVTANDAASYAVTASNSAGTTTSATATLTVNTPPVITTQPISQTVGAKSSVTFTITASGAPAPTYQWYKDGAAISGATNSSFTMRNVSKGNAGTYTAKATNIAGSATSAGAKLTIDSGAKATRLVITTDSTSSNVTIAAQPTSQTVTSGSPATFAVVATSSSALNYQWTKDDVAISGATDATLLVPQASSTDAGTYAVIVNDGFGSLTSDPAALVVVPADNGTSRLANLSVRAIAGTGNETMIVGFVVSGSSSKTLLVRGVGPTLADYGVDGALPNPVLSLYSGKSLIGSNSGWSTSTEAPRLTSIGNNVGAFKLPAASHDAALAPTLTAGAYTAQITSGDNNTGVALVELYDASLDSSAHLANVSVRATVGNGSAAPIIGFVVNGTKPKQLLVRAIGPGLAKYGIDGTLADPQLTIYRDSVAIAHNDDWAGDPALSIAFTAVGAFPIEDPQSKDAAMVFSAMPGAYSAVVTGANNATGVVIVEVYELP